jgi:hypothetical protein
VAGTMTRRLLFTIIGGFAMASAMVAARPQRDDLNRLRWLSGCWELRSGSRLVEERWTPPRGGLMLGMSRTSRNDSIIEFEQVRIETRPAGVFYVASPSRQATAEFRASALLDSAVTFENPEHNFPKLIMYRRVGRDSVVASIAGPRGGQTGTITYPFRRVSCDSA